MASASGHQLLDGIDGLDAAAGAEGGAVEGGGGAGEIELALKGPALQEAVDEAGVKNVSGAGGVNGLNVEGGCVVELRSVPGQDALFAECGGSEAGAQVDALQEGFHAGVEFIYVGDDGNAGGARPARGRNCCGGIVSIDVKGAGIDDPISVEFLGAQSQAVVAFPENGAFTGVIDEDEGLLAGAIGCGEEMSLDAVARKFGAVQFGGAVVADFADVARAQSPLLASNHGGGNLSAKQDFRRAEFDFGAPLGIVCDGDESVGGVEAHTDHVNLCRARHDGPGHCKGSAGVFKGERTASIEARGAPEGEATNNKEQDEDRGQQRGRGPVQRHWRDASHHGKDNKDTGSGDYQKPIQHAARRL